MSYTMSFSVDLRNASFLLCKRLRALLFQKKGKKEKKRNAWAAGMLCLKFIHVIAFSLFCCFLQIHQKYNFLWLTFLFTFSFQIILFVCYCSRITNMHDMVFPNWCKRLDKCQYLKLSSP